MKTHSRNTAIQSARQFFDHPEQYALLEIQGRYLQDRVLATGVLLLDLDGGTLLHRQLDLRPVIAVAGAENPAEAVSLRQFLPEWEAFCRQRHFLIYGRDLQLFLLRATWQAHGYQPPVPEATCLQKLHRDFEQHEYPRQPGDGHAEAVLNWLREVARSDVKPPASPKSAAPAERPSPAPEDPESGLNWPCLIGIGVLLIIGFGLRALGNAIGWEYAIPLLLAVSLIVRLLGSNLSQQ